MSRTIGLFVAVLAFLAAVPASAQPTHRPDRPLVFIPGILGSELWIDGRRAWGSLDALSNLERLRVADGPRAMEPAPTCDPSRREKPPDCGLLNEFVILGPIALGQYRDLLDYLQEKLGYRLENQGGRARTLYIFTYDWRRSNFETAKQFRRFVDTTPGLAGQEFDVLAHSMGGLVALIFARYYDAPAADESCTIPGHCRVKTMVTMGTPYFGSVNAVATPVLGWGWFSRQVAGGGDAIARTVLSWPSYYELLPLYDNCCDLPAGQNLAVYQGFSRLPFAIGPNAPPRAAVEEALAKRRELDMLVRQGWPDHIDRRAMQCERPDVEPEQLDRLYLIAGDYNDTRWRYELDRRGRMSFDFRRGDGTVLLRSATLNAVARANVSFAEHPTIFDDDGVRSRLEHILHRCEFIGHDFAAKTPTIALRSEFGSPQEVAINAASTEIVESLDVDNKPQATIVARLSAALTSQMMPPSAFYVLSLAGAEIARGELSLTAMRELGTLTQFTFASDAIALSGHGLVEAEVSFRDGPTVRDYAAAPLSYR